MNNINLQNIPIRHLNSSRKTKIKYIFEEKINNTFVSLVESFVL